MENKKGAIEMSLNLIIMLIIGMVILGLVIGFVNNLVSKGTDTFDKQISDNDNSIINELKQSSENLAIKPMPSFNFKKGSKAHIFIKVRAYGDKISVKPGSFPKNSQDSTSQDSNNGPSNEDSSDTTDSLTNKNLIYSIKDSTGSDASSKFKFSGPGFSAENGAQDVEMYTLSAEDSADVGIYYLTITLYDKITKRITIYLQ